MKLLEEAIGGNVENTVFLFDEADSILMDRKLILQRNEPGDSLRMVNMLLNILDRRESLFIFTSNFKDKLDLAFLNRCDISYEMGRLSIEGTYDLIKNSLEKLFETEFDQKIRLLDFSSIQACKEACSMSLNLYEIAKDFQKFSPREIKKKIVLNLTEEEGEIEEFVKRLRFGK